MAVAFHASTSNAASTLHNINNGTTTTVTKPTVSSDDILIVGFSWNAGSAGATGTWAAPSGWTQIGSNIIASSGSTHVTLQVWWALQSVASTTFTLTTNTTVDDNSWVCFSFSGVDNTTPIDVVGTGNSNTGANSISVTSITTVTDQALELIFAGDWNGSGAFSSTGFTAVTTANKSNCEISGLYSNTAISPPGASGAKTINDSAGASGNIICYQQFALRPSGGGATVTQQQFMLLGMGN